MKWFSKIVFILSFSSSVFAGENSISNMVEISHLDNENVLFYIQRTINKNTIVYTLNKDENGVINAKNPIYVYWIDYEEGGRERSLTYIQENFSYGVESTQISQGVYQFNFAGYSKRSFYLKKSPKDNEYHVYASLNGVDAELEKLFINIEGGTFWFPNITYVSVEGKEVGTGEKIVEYLKP